MTTPIFPAQAKSIFYLDSHLVLNLEAPVTALLSQVYAHTLARQLPGFRALQTGSKLNFKSLRNCHLTSEQKRGLCHFLQAALCNVGKHSIYASRLDVVCTKQASQHSLQIIDNGIRITGPAQSITSSQGTRQARILSRHLQGKLRQIAILPQGTVYELSWPASVKPHNGFWQFIQQRPQPLQFNRLAR